MTRPKLSGKSLPMPIGVEPLDAVPSLHRTIPPPPRRAREGIAGQMTEARPVSGGA
ncbi:MAG: hypothetical protein KatS3mg060_1095 [Dehalococcoidia bacterium]|nr:MAG: hypothetical protein KatS3mg060_1095 [Dehalococcoidia bacterium]